MTESPNGEATAGTQKWRAGLIMFGILEIGVGALCALAVPLIFLAGLFAPEAMNGMDRRTMIMGPFVYGTLAVILVWLGIGSILCRRWARTLLLILAWSWLLMGVSLMIVLAGFMRLSPPMDGAGALIWIVLFVIVLLGVLLPGIMILFYRCPHVRATCEMLDPQPRWTDACPSPVLTNSLWLGLGALYLLVFSVTGPNVVPLFGALQDGSIATVIVLLLALCLMYLAYSTYRLRHAGWWGTLLLTAMSFASGAVTFARVDLADFYRKSGYPEQQIAQFGSLGMLTGRSALWINLGLFAVFVIYLLWLKKYFRENLSSGSVTK
jgi:hypothetical protein